MRFLWVEDFGEDSEDQEDKKEQWEKYFAIEDTILFTNLEDVLVFLDNYENKAKFDIILLDIRFPVLSGESGREKEEIYKIYFSSFITREIFDKYVSSEMMKDASSGILLFLALIFRYGYSWDNIAFISANIDNDDLSAVTALKELVTKFKYTKKLSARDIALYKTRYLDLFSEEDGYVSRRLKDKNNRRIASYEELISLNDAEMLSEEIIKLNTLQEKLNDAFPAGDTGGLKYCSVRNQFRQIGLRMPPAFEKPTDESQDICWLFKEWTERKADEITLVKRSIHTVCTLLLENNLGNVDLFLKQRRRYNDEEESTISEDTIRQYLQNIQRSTANFPDIKTEGNRIAYAENIVKTVVALWESIKKPKVDNGRRDTYYGFACYAVMKLTRNWLAHQNIKGIDVRFAAFSFMISVKGIFDLQPMPAEAQKEIHREVKKLTDMIKIAPIRYREMNVGKIMEEEYQDMCKTVQKAIPQNAVGKKEKSQMRLPQPSKRDPFALFSALGHEDSRLRKSVSVNEIYKLFWMCLYFGDRDSEMLDPADNTDEEIISILENIYVANVSQG